VALTTQWSQNLSMRTLIRTDFISQLQSRWIQKTAAIILHLCLNLDMEV